MYLEARGLSVDDVASGNLEIKLMNQESVFRDDLIGSFEIDLPKVYGMSPDHSIKNRWIAMNNPDSENISEIKAYLRISVAI